MPCLTGDIVHPFGARHFWFEAFRGNQQYPTHHQRIHHVNGVKERFNGIVENKAENNGGNHAQQDMNERQATCACAFMGYDQSEYQSIQTGDARTSPPQPKSTLTESQLQTFLRYLPQKPSKCPTRIMWPVLETGKNSVNPSTTPKIAATSSECISLIK